MTEMETLPLPALADGAVITVGTFDGLHLGHHEILGALAGQSRPHGLPSVVVTFRPHPLAVVNPPASPKLLTPALEQIQIFASLGAIAPDYVVVMPFSKALANLGASGFVRELLLARYRMRALVVGYDHGLGRGREGSADVLRQLGSTHGFTVDVVPVRAGRDGLPISSTSVRRAVAYGDLSGAAAALGRPYTAIGRVVEGAGRGRTLGFPTINISVPAEKLLPPDGVYAVRVASASGVNGGMVNLGARPTFRETERSLEAHLFDASGDWYEAEVTVEFVTQLRDVTTFSGPAALSEQLHRDEIAARYALTQA